METQNSQNTVQSLFQGLNNVLAQGVTFTSNLFDGLTAYTQKRAEYAYAKLRADSLDDLENLNQGSSASYNGTEGYDPNPSGQISTQNILVLGALGLVLYAALRK